MGAPGTTKGEWFVMQRRHANDILHARGKGDGYNNRVATTHQWSPASGAETSAPEALANAHQMAASGALYDALVAMTRVFMPHPREDTEGWREEHEAFEEALRALAQARGESS